MTDRLLPPGHYAEAWPLIADSTVEQATALGLRYAKLPDGPEKEAALLEIAKNFHPYLMKYLEMIVCGRLPLNKEQEARTINRDVEKFLGYLMKKSEPRTYANYLKACRHLHLAFQVGVSGKHLDNEEIYGILTSILLRVAAEYDPEYIDKIKQIVGVINERFENVTTFTAREISRHMDFDCDRHVGVLCRRGFLVQDGSTGRLRRARRNWPPPAQFLNAKPIGITYYLSVWFRYGLQQYVSRAMSELESKEGVYSLEGYLGEHRELYHASGGEEGSGYDSGRPDDPDIGPHSVNAQHSFLDVSTLTLEWVNGKIRYLLTPD